MAKVTSLICGVILILGLVHSTSAKTYMVGDFKGWTLDADLKAWVKGKTFHDGDFLVFNCASGFSVKEVVSSEYDECNAGHRLTSFWGTNVEVITLKGKGNHYFISTSKESCTSGVKMTLTVV